MKKNFINWDTLFQYNNCIIYYIYIHIYLYLKIIFRHGGDGCIEFESIDKSFLL